MRPFPRRGGAAAAALALLVAAAGCSDEPHTDGGGGQGNVTGGSAGAGMGAAAGNAGVAGALAGVSGSGGGSTGGVASGGNAGATADAGSAGSAGAGVLPVDCQSLPSLPAKYSVVLGVAAAEDLVFDKTGFVWTVIAGNLMKAAYGDAAMLAIPGIVGEESAGTRMLADETLVVADVSNNQVVTVTKAGGTDVLASGMSYPNGIAIGSDGKVYVAEQSGKRVVRIDPGTKLSELIAEDLVNPNGLAFSPDYQKLYVSSFIGGMVYEIAFDAEGKPGPATVLAQQIGKDGHGGLDGVGVDVCGNVYVTEFVTANVWRVTPQGEVSLAVDLSADTSWIPNLGWGSGVGGWDRNTMYVIDRGKDRVFAVEVGVGSAKLPHL